MAITRIIYWIGFAHIFSAALLLLSVIAALLLAEWPMATAFGVSAFLAGLVGGIFMLSTQRSAANESPSEALYFLLIIWVTLPLVFAVPYLMSGMGLGLIQAYFEAASAVTTTGASSISADEAPRSLIFFRASLQFFGGVISVTLAIVILAALNLSGTGVHLSKFFTLKRGELFARLVQVSRIVGLIYAAIAALCCLGLAISGASIFDAICLSLSAVSTGGLTPNDAPIARYISPIGAIILAVTCWLGAANAGILWDIIRVGRKQQRQPMALVANIEHRGMVMVLSAIVLMGVLYVGLSMAFPILIEGAFMVTTAGFDYDVLAIDMLPPALLICVALIGGSAISTAGGLKMIRMVLLVSHANTDLSRMSHPSRVKVVHYRGQKLPDSAFVSIWMYFLGFTLLFGIGAVAMGGLGLPFPGAVAASAAALSNTGPLLDATFPEFNYRQMSAPQYAVLSLLMVLGRVEVLAGLAIIVPRLKL